MNRIRPNLRRLCAIAGAGLAGAAATLAFASPASAHHTEVAGKAICDTKTGEWVVTWTVSNSESDLDGTVKEVKLTPDGSTVTNIAVGATLPKKGAGMLTGVQRLAADEEGASLAVTVEWKRGEKIIVDKKSGSVEFEGTCEVPTAPKPSAEFKTDCTGIVTVILKNAKDATADAKFTVTGKDGWKQEKTVAPGEMDDSIKVPAANSAEIVVTEASLTEPVAKGARAIPANCGGLPVTGVKAGAAGAAALGLLGAGAVLFVMARRRRIRFTA